MKRTWVLLCVLFISSAQADSCERIVSLSPSITEIVFALGLGSHLVGVTRFCNYPPEARLIPRIGGFLDLNTEAIVRTQPSIVFAISEYREKVSDLKQFGLRTLVLDHRNIAGIFSSIEAIGAECRVNAAAQELIASIEKRKKSVQEQVQDLPSTKVLVAIGDVARDGTVNKIFVSGSDGFYSELLALAHAENVYHGITRGISSVSMESVLRFDPEVILQIVAESGDARSRSEADDDSATLAVWAREFPELTAVKTKRVYALRDDFAALPGPRFVDLLEKVARLIHPNATHEEPKA